MPISKLIHAEEDALIEDTTQYVESLRSILPISLKMTSTSAYLCPEGSKGTFLVGENVRDVERQVREYIKNLITPLLN